jgi:ubiquinone/menaquinone biosynthesis C-methylase UbiE
MGTDYGEYLVEAARLLKKGGKLWIAEVSLLQRPVGKAVIDVRA